MTQERGDAGPGRRDLALYRSFMYRFLSRVYKSEPDRELVRLGREDCFRDALKEVGAEPEPHFLADPDETLLSDLALEYTRLFIGPGKHISPHESVYVHVNGKSSVGLWGESTVEVLQFFNSAGLELDPDFHEVPDHVYVELEFMARLTDREGRAWGENDGEGALYCLDMEDKFLERHLSKWVPQFCGLVREESRSPFYRVMASATSGFIRRDRETVASMLA